MLKYVGRYLPTEQVIKKMVQKNHNRNVITYKVIKYHIFKDSYGKT